MSTPPRQTTNVPATKPVMTLHRRRSSCGCWGRSEVEGWRQAPERAIVVELACFLALHVGRPISGDEVRFALRPDGETEISAKSLRTYVSLLRSALGADLVPPATSTGYRISPAVATDWAQFQALSRDGASRDDLAAAMGLVRGRPFTGVPAGSYGWVFTELLISEMETAITSTALRLANAYFRDRAFRSALWAARRGLVGVPGDLRLWEYYLAFARSTGPTEWSAARREARVALGEARRGPSRTRPHAGRAGQRQHARRRRRRRGGGGPRSVTK